MACAYSNVVCVNTFISLHLSIHLVVCLAAFWLGDGAVGLGGDEDILILGRVGEGRTDTIFH